MIVVGSEGKPMLVRILMPENYQGKILVVMLHGFKGFMDWGHFPMFAQELCNQGFPVVQFNFSHNGTSPTSPKEFVEEEAFGNNNYSKELYDLQQVLDALQNEETLLQHKVDTQNIALIGHSRGGGISVLTAANDKRIAKLITWASVAELGAFFGKEILDEWKDNGVIYSYNSRTQQQLPLYFQLYEDVQNNEVALNIKAAISQLEIPVQIVHGTADYTVPVEAAKELHQLCPGSELIIVEDANHTLGGKHPWEEKELPKHTFQILRETIRFLEDGKK